jgi:hypothetical protein
MRIRPSSIQVRFLTQINGIGEKSSEKGEKFSQSRFEGRFGGLDWSSGEKLDGEKYDVSWNCQMLRLYLLAFRK